MQALFASLLAARLLAPSVILRLAFTLIVAAAPPLYFRNGHLALMAHWILLAAFYLATTPSRTPFWRTYSGWMLLALIGSLVHPYWPPMVLTIAVGVFLYQGYSDCRIRRSKSIAAATLITTLKIAGLTTSSLAGFWALGILSQPKPRDNVYNYTADILMHFNSYGWSPFIPALFKFRSGQYEGFSYIGAGVLALFILFLFRKKIFKDHEYPIKKFINPNAQITGLSLGCFFLYLWSLGAKVRLFAFTMGYLNFIYQPLQPILGSFRSAGRFAWAVHYLIILLIFLWLSQLWSSGKKKQIAILALLAIALQFAEFVDKPGRFFIKDQTFARLNSAEWRPVLTGKTTIAMIPPEIPDTPCKTLENADRRWLPLALIAVEYGLKFNSGARANPPKEPGTKYCLELIQKMNRGEFDPNTAYVIPPWADQTPIAQFKGVAHIECHHLSDGYTVCI